VESIARRADGPLLDREFLKNHKRLRVVPLATYREHCGIDAIGFRILI
jgi:hypothetical protein